MNAFRVAAVVGLSISTAADAPAQTQILDTIRVAARSSGPSVALTRSTEVIGRDELARRAGHDLADILTSSLGVDVVRRSPAQADLSIRGSSFNQIVVLVDGIRVSDVQSGHYNLDLAVPTASIERIEILRGGASTLYGADAIGGVVNIVTRRGGSSAIAAHAGTFGTVGSDLAIADSGRVAFRVSGDARRSDGHRVGTDYRAVQGRAGASSALSGGTVSLDAGLGVRNFGAADFYGAFPSYEDTRTTTAALRYDRAIANQWRIDASADVRRHYDLHARPRQSSCVSKPAPVMAARCTHGGDWTAKANEHRDRRGRI
jgi:iron complex outermembrane receptor protein